MKCGSQDAWKPESEKKILRMTKTLGACIDVTIIEEGGQHIFQNCLNFRFFRAELSFYLNELRRNIVGNGSASSKKLAAQDCALSLVRQLFHMKLIDAAEVGQVQPKKLKLEVRRCFSVY